LQIADCKLQIVEDRGTRHGITLVELLVAISIIAILMTVAARMIDFSVEDRRTREAGRAITIYLGSVRNRAMESGRPCGVMLRRLEGQPLCVVGLDQVEVPPPYAGDTLESAARLQISDISGGLASLSAKMLPEINADLVSDGDLVQFNYQGPFYTIVARTATSLTLQVDLRQGQILPWPRVGDTPPLSPPMPYQIIRRPRKSAVTGLQLPLRAVIDMEFSGTDEHSIGAQTNLPVYIMFSPNGSLERVYHHGKMHPGIEPIFLLVGKQERVPLAHNGPSPAEDGLYNWQDLKNLWVTLNPQTGLVTTTEVAKGSDPFESRGIAREGQSMGGR